MGWVPINKLMEDYSILSSCVESTITWLEGMPHVNNIIFIGIDFWGSIIASQLSVRMNVCNMCLSTKKYDGSLSVYKDSLEKSIDQICSSIKLDSVVLVTDVISSGRTVHNIYAELNKILSDKHIEIGNWVVVSIIADIKKHSDMLLSNFAIIGTFCGSLKIPVIKSLDLPDEDILPPKHDLR